MKDENYQTIFNRLKDHMQAKSDADVARGLGVSPQALSSFKKQGKFPSDLLIKYCFTHKLSVDWLLTGEGPMHLEERKDILMVKESTVPYGAKAQPMADKEREYVDKLIMIFRFKDEETIKAITQNIDQFLRVPNKEASIEPRKKDEEVA